MEDTCYPQIRWCPFAREPYARALQSDNLNLISKCEKATQDGDMQSSIRHFYALVQDAAENSGMYKLEKGRHAQKRQRLHQPFFDYECKTLKRDVWRYGMLANWRGPEFKKLERKYHATVRKKKRIYQAQKLKSVVHQKKTNPHRFWKTLKREKDRLPDALRDVSAWDPYIQSLARGLGSEDPHQGIPSEAYPPPSGSPSKLR